MITANIGYALAQLERAIETAVAHEDAEVRERALARVAKWRDVVGAMSSTGLRIGSRTPTSAPAWATLEVLHGGFASGNLSAGGPLSRDEEELASRIGAPSSDRRELNCYFLSDAGRAELAEMLSQGLFDIAVPEEGALLTVAALLARGDAYRAAELLEVIAPYLDRLRFYPRKSLRARESVSTVHCATVGQVRKQLLRLDTPSEVSRMNASLAVWIPLTDRCVDLWIETVEGEMPHLRDDVVLGGWPCRVWPDGWTERARGLIADDAAAQRSHGIVQRAKDAKSNYSILRTSIACALEDPQRLTGREIGRIRRAIAAHVSKHGAPGSAFRRALRAEQASVAARPTRGDSARVLASRLASFPGDGGVASLEFLAIPVSDSESKDARVPAGTPLYPSVIAKLDRCLEASVEELVQRGVLTSGEALARVLPQISAHVRALGFTDPELVRLAAAIDAAFRRRRSLLLLNYESQVRLGELPWVRALEPWARADTESREGARRLLTEVTTLAVRSFPHAIVPNPLLAELRALAERAELDLPLVDELAADIFMGGFTAKFVRSAAIVARVFEGTLYARYYALPIGEVRAIASQLQEEKGPVPAFGALCERLAGAPRSGSVARNGLVIEQQQILTTQNLVPLIDALGLADSMRTSFPELAERCFVWICRRTQMRTARRIDRLRTAKNAAYAWRQMIAYLTLAEPGSVDAFLASSRAHLAAQPTSLVARFEPLLEGVDDAANARSPRVRLLGWTTGPHPLVD
jgi:hypothetical protein